MFGFSRRKALKLRLNQQRFKPGEDISGTIILKLKKKVIARGLRVAFTGERIERQGDSYTWKAFVEVSQGLGNERTYRGGESSSFTLTIPEDVFEQANPAFEIPPGILGKIVERLGSFRRERKVRWIVTANLDIPKAFDARVTKDIKLFTQGGAEVLRL